MIDFTTTNQFLQNKKCVSINKQEEQFVVFDFYKYSLMFYNFNEQFQIANYKEFILPNFKSVKKAEYTSDSKNLLVITN